MTFQTRRDTDAEKLLLVRWELAARDPLNFMRWFSWTADQHDLENPIKPFPWQKPHVQRMTRLWQHNRRLVVTKSRQMIQTWQFCDLALWDALFHPGRLIFLQSKREEDAIGNEVSGTGLLGRVKFILNHIPAGRLLLPPMRQLSNKIEFPTLNSTLWAIPEGGQIIRTHTASGVLSDEAAFQPEFAEAYTSAMPCIRGGGWFVALSTPDPGFFQLLYEDRIGEEM